MAKLHGWHEPAAGPEVKKDAAPKAETARKIRYTATVHVVVKNLDESGVEIEKLIERQAGYLAKSETIGSTGYRRVGTWVIKVPVENYRATVQSLAQLGIVERNTSDSEDLTEEFIDIEARLKNMKAEEEVLNKLLKDGANKLEDMLKIREHIVRVRGDIERAEGRKKFVLAATDFSTINVTLREDADYVSPTAPSFDGEIASAFSNSVLSLKKFGQAAIIGAVAIAPWIPPVLVVAFLLRLWVRRLRSDEETPARSRRRSRGPSSPQEALSPPDQRPEAPMAEVKAP